jgi:DNA (cytosine-5)-methyltransferase 1
MPEQSMNVLSLFSGIPTGGLELGLERAGMTVVGQVEIDEFCRRVLAKHWPEVPRHDDVRTAVEWWLGAARPRVDVVCGGFPCQPFSTAGLRLGVGDPRWGWPWMRAVIRALRPRFVVVENVAALLDDADAFGWLLGDLAEDGFDADWSVLSACAVGAPHTRERLFLVAYPDGGDGQARLGAGSLRPGPVPDFDDRARAWRDRVDWSLATSRSDDREVDGSARWLVAAGGDAVVPQVAEHIGRLVMGAAS